MNISNSVTGVLLTVAYVILYVIATEGGRIILTGVAGLALVGLIPAVIARGKGADFFRWWVYGVALFLVALIHALLMQPNTASVDQRLIAEGGRKCPHCAEIVRADARVCKHCSRDLPPAPVTITAPTTPSPAWSGGIYSYTSTTDGVPMPIAVAILATLAGATVAIGYWVMWP